MFNRRLFVNMSELEDEGDGIKPEYGGDGSGGSGSTSLGYNRFNGYGNFNPWKNLTIKTLEGEVLHTYDLTYLYINQAGSRLMLFAQLSNITPPYTTDLPYNFYITIDFPDSGLSSFTNTVDWDNASPSGASLVSKIILSNNLLTKYFSQHQREWIPCTFIAEKGDDVIVIDPVIPPPNL